jgi:hypothetical protein
MHRLPTLMISFFSRVLVDGKKDHKVLLSQYFYDATTKLFLMSFNWPRMSRDSN